jgi:hypothetical protein
MHIRKNAPDRNEQGCHQRANHNAIDPEQLQPAERGDEHNIVGHPRVPPDQDRTHKIVDHADHEHAADDQHDTLQDIAGDQQKERHRDPDESGADCGNQGKYAHQHRP